MLECEGIQSTDDMSEQNDTDRTFELHMEEYRALRSEISDLQKQRFTTAQLGIAGIVAMWAYLLSLDPCKVHVVFAFLGWLLPVLIAAGCAELTRRTSSGIRHGGAYLAMIEQVYAHTDLGGWQNRLMRMKAAEAQQEKDNSKKALINLSDYPAASDPEIGAIFDVLRERSEEKRPSKTLAEIWGGVIVLTVGAALIGALVIASKHSACQKLDALVIPAVDVLEFGKGISSQCA